MTTTLPCVLLPVLVSFFADDAALEIRYRGSLEQVSRTAENVEVKQFDVYCLLHGKAAEPKLAFLVDERGGGGWAWPERFGEITLNPKHQPTNAARIRVLHTHESTPSPLLLQQPLFEHTEKLNDGAVWTVDKTRYEVQRATKRGNRDCWEVDVFTDIGKRQTLWIEEDTGLVVAAKSKVTLGRGDQFELLQELDSAGEVAAPKLVLLQKPLATLLKLQTDLKRREHTTKPELSPEQLALAEAALKSLAPDAADTPFRSLVSMISRDVKLQSQRDDDVEILAKRIVGKPAPAFELMTLTGDVQKSADLKGQVVVLHFWKYHDNPLTEPYGQVAYLDYLHNRRQKLGVKIVGVAVDPRIEKPAELALVKRDVRKFREFMNLSYPIALNSKTLLKDLGDPQQVGAALPLWVVIDHHGKIVHYKAGFYEINPDKGLEELDAVVIPLIRQRRAEAANQ